MKKRIILMAILIVLLAAGGYGAYFWHQINNPEDLFEIPDNNINPSEKPGPADETTEPTIEPYEFTEKRLNLLLLGLDADEYRYKKMGAFRTDTIMLASIDFTQNSVELISIPRDSYVKIPGRKEKGRVNAAFVYGGGFKGEGFATTIQTVSDLLGGITIQYYAAIDMNVFVEIIDALGGITYEIDVPVSSAGIQPGLQKLDGKQTLAYARHRKTPGGDIDRVDRQQRLMLGILEQLKSTDSLKKLPKIYEAVKDDVWTNLNIRQIAALALFAARLDMENLNRHMIPGTYLDMDNISYWGIDQKKKNQLVNELFGLNITEYDKEDDVYYIKAQLRKKLNDMKKAIQDWVSGALRILSDYENVLLEEERSELESGILMLDEALEKGDVENAEDILQEMNDYQVSLTPQLENRKTIFLDARAVLSMVEEQYALYSERITEDDTEILSSSIHSLRHKMEKKQFTEISPAALELKSFWNSLKERLDDQAYPLPTQVPSPEPEESPTPSPSDQPTDNPDPDTTPSPTSEPTEAPTEGPDEDEGNEG